MNIKQLLIATSLLTVFALTGCEAQKPLAEETAAPVVAEAPAAEPVVAAEPAVEAPKPVQCDKHHGKNAKACAKHCEHKGASEKSCPKHHHRGKKSKTCEKHCSKEAAAKS